MLWRERSTYNNRHTWYLLQYDRHRLCKRLCQVKNCPNAKGKNTYFHSTHLTQRRGQSTSWNSVCFSVCLSVRHRFNISNIGPLNHPKTMSDPTYYTSLERGWHQRWQWQWRRHTQRQWQRQYASKTHHVLYFPFSIWCICDGTLPPGSIYSKFWVYDFSRWKRMRYDNDMQCLGLSVGLNGEIAEVANI